MKTIPILPSVEAFENKDVCSRCGGACCKYTPGALHPLDIAPSGDIGELFEKINEMVNGGDYIITVRSLEKGELSNEMVRVVTPRTSVTKRSSAIFEDYNIGQCVFHSETGCSLKDRNRPIECRTLVPDPEGELCRTDKSLDKLVFYEEWQKHSEVLDVIDELHWEEVERRQKEKQA